MRRRRGAASSAVARDHGSRRVIPTGVLGGIETLWASTSAVEAAKSLTREHSMDRRRCGWVYMDQIEMRLVGGGKVPMGVEVKESGRLAGESAAQVISSSGVSPGRLRRRRKKVDLRDQASESRARDVSIQRRMPARQRRVEVMRKRVRRRRRMGFPEGGVGCAGSTDYADLRRLAIVVGCLAWTS
jgi:hypothetical protein